MPVLTGPVGATNLALDLAAELAQGRPARASFGSRDAAFVWAGGLPDILARHVSSAVVDGLAFNAVRVKPSGTPATKVAKGGTKPAAVTITSSSVALAKYAGIGTFATEDQLSAEGLASAIAAVMTSSILMAYDADCVAALTVAGQPTATAATWPAAILGGVSAVAAGGGRPNLAVISTADYASIAASPGLGYALDPSTAVVTVFGLDLVLSANLATKTAFVMDSAAALAVENSQSPIAIADPYSGLSTNELRLAIEGFLGFVVTNPGSVAKVTYSGT